MHSARYRAYIYLTTVSAIWGIATIVIKHTLTYLPPFTFLTYRFLISLVIILPFLYIHLKKRRYTFSQFKEVSLLTFVGVPFNLALVFVGINYTSALEASLILSVGPILTVLGGYLFLKEHITRRELIGLSIAILGTFIVILEPLISSTHRFDPRNLLGNFILLFSNLSLAYYTLRSKVDLHHKYSPWFITMIGFVVAPIFILPFTLSEQPLSQLASAILQVPPSAHLGAWYMAILSGILAYFLYQAGLKRIEASEATVFHYLANIFGIPLAVFVLKETLTIPYLAGAIVVIIGVFISEYRPSHRQTSLFNWITRHLNHRERFLYLLLLCSLAILLSSAYFYTRAAAYLNGYYNPAWDLLFILVTLGFLGYLTYRKLRRLPVMPHHFITGYLIVLISLLANIASLI